MVPCKLGGAEADAWVFCKVIAMSLAVMLHLRPCALPEQIDLWVTQPDPVSGQDRPQDIGHGRFLWSKVSGHQSYCMPLQMAPSNLLESKFAMLEGLGGSLDDDLDKLKADLRLKGKLPNSTSVVVPNSIIWE